VENRSCDTRVTENICVMGVRYYRTYLYRYRLLDQRHSSSGTAHTFKPVAAHGELSLDVLQGVLKVGRLPGLVPGTESSRFQKIRLFLTLGAEDVIHCKISTCLQYPSGLSSIQ
jgi:hypothetical protein